MIIRTDLDPFWFWIKNHKRLFSHDMLKLGKYLGQYKILTYWLIEVCDNEELGLIISPPW